MGWKEADTKWKIIYALGAVVILFVFIFGICLIFLLKTPTVSVLGATVVCNTNEALSACRNRANLPGGDGVDLQITFLIDNPNIAACDLSADVELYDTAGASEVRVQRGTTSSGKIAKKTKEEFVATFKLFAGGANDSEGQSGPILDAVVRDVGAVDYDVVLLGKLKARCFVKPDVDFRQELTIPAATFQSGN